MSALLKALGARLEALRESKGISRDDLAQMVGVTRTSIYGWEKGVHNIPIPMIEKLLKALEIGPSELFEYEASRITVLTPAPMESLRVVIAEMRAYGRLKSRVPAHVLKMLPYIQDWELFTEVVEPMVIKRPNSNKNKKTSD